VCCWRPEGVLLAVCDGRAVTEAGLGRRALRTLSTAPLSLGMISGRRERSLVAGGAGEGGTRVHIQSRVGLFFWCRPC